MPKKFAIISPTGKGKTSGLILSEFMNRKIEIQNLVPKELGVSEGFTFGDRVRKSPTNPHQSTEPPFFILNKEDILPLPDVALVRGVGSKIPAKIFFRLDWMWILEKRRVRLVNSRRCLEIATNKMLTSSVLTTNHIPTPETILCENDSVALKSFELLGGDIVSKPLYGARGHDVERYNNMAQFKTFLLNNQQEEIYYLQKFYEHDNQDYRLLVIGDQVVCAMRRKANSWKTNLAQGGTAHAIKPSSEMITLALSAARAVEGEIIGVDIMETAMGLMVIEVNAVPGFIGLQSVTPINIAKKIVDYLVELA